MEPHRAGRVSPWAIALAAAVALFSLLFFLQTRDPFIFVSGIFFGGLVLLVARLLSARTVVRVRCRECRALNDDSAAHCGQCGRPL